MSNENQQGLARVAPRGIVGWESPEWTEERIELMRKAIAPPTATPAEVEFFVAWCKRTGLDPFIKQAYLVERSAQDAQGNWSKKHEPLAAETGMAARADALPDYRGMRAAAVYAGDVFAVDEETQTVSHKWDLASRAKAGNKVIGAWAHVQREGRVVPITYLPIETRIARKRDGSATKFWATDPAGMLVKCARADALRRAYPNIFGGVFIREEMSDEREVEAVEQPRRIVDAGIGNLKAVVAKKAEETRAPPPAEPAQVDPNPAPPSPPKPEEKKAEAPPPAKAPVLPLPLAEAVWRFGEKKGQPLAQATGVELAEAKAKLQGELKASPKAPWRDQAVAALAELGAEIEQREAAMAAQEPGSEG